MIGASTRTSAHRRTLPRPWAPWLLGAAAVLCQMAFPFTDGGTPTLTVVAVLLLAGASLSWARHARGPLGAAALLGIAGGGGLLAEAVGVHTGLPFGEYAYTGSLGAQLLGVPLVVPVAWVMMSYPALLVGRRLARTLGGARTWLAVPLGAWALASWDVFLDPQMVAAGHWRWEHPEPGLPGVDGIPLTNFAGWLLVSVLLVAALGAVLDRLGEPSRRDVEAEDQLPGVLYLWTYGSSVLANVAFFGSPSVALVGGLLMGLVAVPYARAWWRTVRSGR